MPAGASVSFDTAPIAGLEHHLWMLEGALTLEVEGSVFRLRAGDCLRYVLAGATRFRGRANAAPATSSRWCVRERADGCRGGNPDRGVESRPSGNPVARAGHRHAGRSPARRRPRRRRRQLRRPVRARGGPRVLAREGIARRARRHAPGARGAFGSRIVGTVQLDLAVPPNQRHRAEVVKILVHPTARRRGIARALMVALEPVARSEGGRCSRSTPGRAAAPSSCICHSATSWSA